MIAEHSTKPDILRAVCVQAVMPDAIPVIIYTVSVKDVLITEIHIIPLAPVIPDTTNVV